MKSCGLHLLVNNLQAQLLTPRRTLYARVKLSHGGRAIAKALNPCNVNSQWSHQDPQLRWSGRLQFNILESRDQQGCQNPISFADS
ncbi:Berberine bridge enzyme-like 1 [Fusarium oxysporum f. sp. albedinis]|nr:Berberine bridge enzyme-like 1 [Fusarium oxysporum f. sp. albedinis]